MRLTRRWRLVLSHGDGKAAGRDRGCDHASISSSPTENIRGTSRSGADRTDTWSINVPSPQSISAPRTNPVKRHSPLEETETDVPCSFESDCRTAAESACRSKQQGTGTRGRRPTTSAAGSAWELGPIDSPTGALHAWLTCRFSGRSSFEDPEMTGYDIRTYLRWAVRISRSVENIERGLWGPAKLAAMLS